MSRRESQQLDGQWAVVTGSSRGIGRAIALEFAGAGANVVVHARSRGELAEETAAEVRACGGEALAVVADLSDSAGRDALLTATVGAGLPVSVWVNNAGVDVLTGAAASWTFAEKLAALWAVDVAATIELSRAAGAAMRDGRGGVILNMGWDQAASGMAGDSGEMFATVKGAVAAFTCSLAKSLAPRVRVNCLAPGWIRTAWGDDASPYWQARAQAEALVGRWGEPRDVARAALFLASPAGEFVNGQVLAINGGFAGHAPAGREGE
ncbi:MAG: SDR family oxidoreductase [Pirellulales bacterium]|nr:SDR family oxidoreductase [Pirellulales bacterium]